MQSIAVFTQIHKKMDEDDFLEKFPQPFLLLDIVGGSLDPVASPIVGSLDKTISAVRGGPLPYNFGRFIVPVKKKPDNREYVGSVTLGRSEEADIELPFPTVSKIHAVLSMGDDGWILTDLGSANGTFLGEDTLEPEEPHPLSDGTLIGIGTDVSACFYTAHGYYLLMGAL